MSTQVVNGVQGEVVLQAEDELSPQERAEARDHYVRDFDSRWGDWVAIAKVCVDVERDQDWKTLGFHSFEAWLLAAAPRSRSYLYLVIGRYKELSVDIPESDLAQMPLGSAGVLKQLSSNLRRDPKVREAAKKTPKEFREALRETHPEQALEDIVTVKLNFPISLWRVISARFEIYQLTDPTATLIDFVEYLVSQESE